MTPTHHTPVLIVGSGPTGLTLACELSRRNIPCRIIERSPEYPQGSRAKGMQPRSIEIMDDLGIADELIAASFTELKFRRFNGSQLLGDITREVFPRDDTKYIQGLILPQWRVEEVLRNKLAGFGVSVELGIELISFSQTDTTVVAVLQTADGTETLTADYLVGSDGGKSTVRKALGINFAGETHEMERAFVGDVEVEGLVPDAWHVWIDPQVGFSYALCPFKCTDKWQVQAIAVPDENGGLPEPSLETFQKLFRERAQIPGVILKNCTWQSLYRVNVRMAEKYRAGRVFIAGDAAHAHSIAGGLGMNTGIQDAYNLGWKLAAVINNEAEPYLLDTYEEERLPIAAWTLNTSSERQKAMQDSASRGGGLSNIATKDTTQLNLNYRYSSLSKYTAGSSTDSLQAGDRAPDALLADGSWLSSLYQGTHFTILGFGSASETLMHFHQLFGKKIKTCGITDAQAVKLYGNLSGLFVIRPDGYIGLVAGPSDKAAVESYLDALMTRDNH